MSKKKNTEVDQAQKEILRLQKLLGYGGFDDFEHSMDERVKVKGEIVLCGKPQRTDYDVACEHPQSETFSIPAILYSKSGEDAENRRFSFEFLLDPNRNLRMNVFELRKPKSFWTADQNLIEFFDGLMERASSWNKTVMYTVPGTKKKLISHMIPRWMGTEISPSMNQYQLLILLAENAETIRLDMTSFMPLVETAIENRVHWIIDVVFGEFQKMVNEFRRIEKIHYKEFEEIMDL